MNSHEGEGPCSSELYGCLDMHLGREASGLLLAKVGVNGLRRAQTQGSFLTVDPSHETWFAWTPIDGSVLQKASLPFASFFFLFLT